MTARICADCGQPAEEKDGYTFWRKQSPRVPRLEPLCRGCAGKRDAGKGERAAAALIAEEGRK